MRNTIFLGGGNMAFAIINGLIAQGAEQSSLHVIEINPDAQNNIRKIGISCSATWPEDFAAAQVVLAVKPQVMKQVLEDNQANLSGKLLISIAAGVTVEQLLQWSGQAQAPVARAMPNTPALVGQGMTGLYFTDNCNNDDKTAAEQLFKACGEVHTVGKEDDINLIIAISGSGPGFVFYMMEALESAALSLGFEPEKARKLVNQTFLGSAALASQSDDSLSTLREKVTSKGGTTHAGLEAMRLLKVAEGIGAAPQAAKARAEALQRGE